MFRALDYFVYAYVLLINLKVGRFRRDLIVWLDSKQVESFLPSVFEKPSILRLWSMADWPLMARLHLRIVIFAFTDPKNLIAIPVKTTHLNCDSISSVSNFHDFNGTVLRLAPLAQKKTAPVKHSKFCKNRNERFLQADVSE